ncbi:meiosis regulator and mRNA stability factor 1-like isoform X2 [Liolophura sinensis]|uniref:meiosis regulator and mRNA stability factor 1-like isoform X2 n=1 Tax=Liolophura sinensis TaxID=3198878 RepID=UPI0031590849
MTMGELLKLKPIGVFWDIENCCVPRNRSALCVVQKIRDYFFSGYREAEFMCVCDINKESKQIIQELNSAQINVVHIDAVSKNAADDKLRQSMRRFSDAYSPPASVVLISSDINFSSDLSDLRHRKNFQVILIHGPMVHDALLACANETYLFDDLVRDLPFRTLSKDGNGLLEVMVTGLPQGRESNKIKHRLKQLSANCGGRVVRITADYALLKFQSKDAAFKAKKRMDGEDVYGCKISVDFAAAIEALPVKPGTQPNVNRPEYNTTHPVHVPYPQSPCRYRPSKPTTYYRPSYTAPITEPPYLDRGGSYYNRHSPNCHQQRTPPKSYPTKPLYEMFKRPLYQEEPYKPEHDPNHPSIGSTGVDSFYNHHVYPSFEPNYQHGHNYNSYHGSEHQQSSWPPSPDSRNGYPGRRSPRASPYYHPFRTPFSPYFQEPLFNRYSPVYPPETGFQPIRYPTPPPRPSSAPTVDNTSSSYYTDANGPVELAVSNLDYNITAKEWRKILFTTFHPQVKVLNVYVKTQPDNTSIGMVKVPSVEEARFAISQFHRKKIGYKRIHVALKNEDSQQTATNIRAEATALLMEAKGHVLPLFKFIELFDKRYHRSISVCELYKMKDIIDIREQGGAGRMVYLLEDVRSTPSPQDNADMEIQEILEVPVCLIHCPEGSTGYVEALNCTMLPNVNIQMKTFAAQVHTMLQSHEGNMALMSFVACYEAEFSPLDPCEDGGVPLEHLISCVPGTQIVMSKTGVKKVQWMENKPILPNGILTDLPDVLRASSSPLLTQQMSQISREIVDLLKHHPQCRMPFSKFIPAYHHHFGRQCRVADYGYTKLYELFDALPHVLQVMGTGDRRILTLSHRAQVRRFTTDLLRILKAHSAKQIQLSDLAECYEKVIGKPLDICEYGMCCPEDLLTEIPATTILTSYTEAGTILAIPRRDQTSEEVERTKQFSLEVVDLLKHNPQCRMPFNKFIPAYHHHFGRQCRVSDYGFAKLIELFEAIPHVVELEDEGEERFVRLTEPELKKVLSEQVVKLLGLQYNGQLSLDNFYRVFTCHFGFTLRLRDFKASSIKELLAQLKHVVRIDVQDGVEYVVLCRQSHFPKLARQILQLLMNQSSGSLPLVELCSRYKTSFGTDCDVGQIREELLDFVQVTGGEESAVISLTPLQIFARDVRILLKAHNGKILLHMFESTFQDHFGVEIKPALYGFPTVVDLLAAIPHVVLLRGRGQSRLAMLSHDMQDVPPICGSPPLNFLSSPPKLMVISPPREPQPSRTPSKSPSNDSGVMDTQDETELLWQLTDEEKKGQKTPLCKTPTSELLHFAAQCLQPDGSEEIVEAGLHENPVTQSGGFRRTLPSHSTPTGQDKYEGKISELEKSGDDTVQELSEAFSKGWWKESGQSTGKDEREIMDTTADSLNISAVKGETLPFSSYLRVDAGNGGEGLSEAKSTTASSPCGDSGIRSQDVSESSFQDDNPVETSSMKSDQSIGMTHLNITPKTSPRKSPRKPRIAAKFLVPIDST